MYRRVMRSHGVIAATVELPWYLSGIVAPGCTAGHVCCATSAGAASAIATDAAATDRRMERWVTDVSRRGCVGANGVPTSPTYDREISLGDLDSFSSAHAGDLVCLDREAPARV